MSEQKRCLAPYSRCRCVRPAGHDGHHHCSCGGLYDEDLYPPTYPHPLYHQEPRKRPLDYVLLCPTEYVEWRNPETDEPYDEAAAVMGIRDTR